MSRQRNDRETEGGGTRPHHGLVPSPEAMAALVCGCLSTGRFAWQGSQLWRLFCMWLAADIMLGCAMRALVALKAVSPSRRGHARVVLPYAAEGSPGQRLADALGSLLRGNRDEAQRDALYHSSSALCASCVMLVLATFLGREPLAVAAAVLLGGVLLVVAAGPRRERTVNWLAGWHVAAAWALGGVILAPVRPSIIGVALLAGVGTAIAHWGEMTSGRVPRSARSRRSLWARRASRAIWLGAVGVLLVTRQPILAALVALIALSVVAADEMSVADATSVADAAARLSVASKALGRRGWVVAQVVMALAMAYWS